MTKHTIRESYAIRLTQTNELNTVSSEFNRRDFFVDLLTEIRVNTGHHSQRYSLNIVFNKKCDFSFVLFYLKEK